MEEDFPESRLDDELQTSKTEAMKDLNLQDQHNQNPESLKQGQELHSLHSSLDQVQVQDKARSQDEAEHETCAPDPPLDPVQGVDQSPTRHDCDRGRASGEESDDHRWFSVWDQDPSQAEQNQDPAQRGDQDGASPQDQDRHPVTATAYQEAAGESGGSVPALVITQAVEALRPQRPADLVIPVIPTDPGLSSGSDGGDMACSDLLSLRSDSLSLASEPTISRTSEDDDITSVAASSVMSLFQRVQLDPLEKHWLRSSALGNMAAQRLMLSQEPSLVLKKDFINTALHWAAKQGRQEAVDMMLRSGADVNVKSGYTALHLASIHGHQHVVHALINTYNAKTNIRDYHGKTAVHYWSGCSDAFDKPDTPSGARFSRGRWTQRYALPSMLLSRSRSQGQLNLDFGTVPQSPSHGALDLQL